MGHPVETDNSRILSDSDSTNSASTEGCFWVGFGGSEKWEEVWISHVENEAAAHCGLFIQGQNLEYDGLVVSTSRRGETNRMVSRILSLGLVYFI